MNLVVDEQDFLNGIFTVKMDGVPVTPEEFEETNYDLKVTLNVASHFFKIYESFKTNDTYLINGMFLNKGYSKVKTFDEFVNHVYSGNFVVGLKDIDFKLIRQIHKLAYKDGMKCY